MALDKLAKDDYLTQSFGQKSEAVQSGTYGLVVGGINQTSPTSIGDGEFSPLNVDTSGNLMVNIAAGEVISATVNVGTINAATVDIMKVGTINTGTVNTGTINVATVTAGTLTALANGTITAGTLSALANGTITAGSIVMTVGTIAAGTINTIGKYASYLGTITVPTSDTVQAATVASSLNGIVRAFTFVTPALEGTGTSTLALVDAAGGAIISKAQDEGLTTAYGTTMPITTSMNWTVTCNGTQSTARAHVINVHYEL